MIRFDIVDVQTEISDAGRARARQREKTLNGVIPRDDQTRFAIEEQRR